MTARGILAYGAYVPYHRLKGSTISAALGQGGGRGTRSVASFDEDAVSMATEAARRALRTSPVSPSALTFSTATPPYLDKTNATVIHAALQLGSDVWASDAIGSPRSFTGSLRAAMRGSEPTLVTGADVRTGLPGSADEAATGDAGVALVVGGSDDGALLAQYAGGASVTHEFLDRWRLPGWNHSKVWEERFGEHAYLPMVTEAVDAACKQSGIEPADIDVAIITGLHARAVRGAARAAGLGDVRVASDLTTTIGNTGTPHLGVALASVLDEAAPDRTILMIHLADGVTAAFLRTTDALADYQSSDPVAAQIDRGNDDLDYNKFLTWRGLLDREPPRRPDPEPPYAPPALRSEAWKYGFVGSRDRSSGAVHLPPQRVSVRGGAVDDMEPAPMADVGATIATFTIDRLAYSLSPPTIAAVIDFDGGGRFTCQMTDASPDDVKIGDRVEMTFRRIDTNRGIHNYFWKARPAVG